MTRRIVEAKTYAFQANRSGVGSSSLLGDAIGSYLPVPPMVPDNGSRFLFRLCAVHVPAHEQARVVGYKFSSLIGARIQVEISGESGPLDTWSYPLDREVVSPFWSFADGNIVYTIRKLPIASSRLGVRLFSPSVQHGSDGLEPALLCLEDPTDTGRPYAPPKGGEFDGEPLVGLDRITDQPGTWSSTEGGQDYTSGPCTIVAYASVLQTDPATRPYLPLASLPAGELRRSLRPEDQFLLLFQGHERSNGVVYTGVSGALRVEYLPQDDPCLLPHSR